MRQRQLLYREPLRTMFCGLKYPPVSCILLDDLTKYVVSRVDRITRHIKVDKEKAAMLSHDGLVDNVKV